MADEDFFKESLEQSKKKSRIVTKYFGAWARVVLRAAKARNVNIAYVDLFAGPGRYKDGTPSTPEIVLRKAINDADLREKLVTLFNDKDPANVQSLSETVKSLPGTDKLRHQPYILNEEVGPKIADTFKHVRFVPTLLFVDPWGYKGLSLALINSVLRHWGCDCVFFFNYNRINAGMTNEAVREHMDDLFGKERAETIRAQLEGLSPDERESLIMRELSSGLADAGGKFVLRFAFKNDKGTRTKHYLIFATKNRRGYEIMKTIMAKESSELDQGVASFSHTFAASQNQFSLGFGGPIDELEEMLLTEFAGESIAMRRIYERHSVGRPYIESNYKKALTNLEFAKKIYADPPSEKRRKGTFGPDVIVTFPPRAGR